LLESNQVIYALYQALVDEGCTHDHAIAELESQGYRGPYGTSIGAIVDVSKAQEGSGAPRAKEHGARKLVTMKNLSEDDAYGYMKDLVDAGYNFEQAVNELGITMRVEGERFQDWYADFFDEDVLYGVGEDEEPEEDYDDEDYGEPATPHSYGKVGEVREAMSNNNTAMEKDSMHDSTSASKLFFTKVRKDIDKAVRDAKDFGEILTAFTEAGVIYTAGTNAPHAIPNPDFDDYTVKKDGCVVSKATSNGGATIQFTILPDGELRAYWAILTP